jgi:hypothetical protein
MPANPRIPSKATRATCKQNFLMAFSPKAQVVTAKLFGSSQISEHSEQNA